MDPLAIVLLIAGILIGLGSGWAWFSKSKGQAISKSQQAEIDARQQEILKLNAQLSEVRGQIKAAEAEAKAAATCSCA